MSWQYTAISYRGGYSRLVPWLLISQFQDFYNFSIIAHLWAWSNDQIDEGEILVFDDRSFRL